MTLARPLIQKFGGSSLGTPQRIREVAGICARETGRPLVVVVSAMGKTTDSLLGQRDQVCGLGQPRECDLLLSTGEQVSAALLAMALQEQGLAAEALTGWQAGIRTDGSYGDARITDIDTTRIRQGLDSGKIVVVTGFQGICDGEITTLGRGGSDTSAVALAVALGAERCDIYTDVTAVHTADPRVVPQVGRHGRITYEEMLELANLGAKVLHPRSVDIARLYGLPVRVRSSWHVEDEGTLVCNDMEIKRSVSGVALDRGRARLSILGVSDRPGIADRIFGALAEAGISVDIIVQCASHDGVTEMDFTVRQQDGEAALKILRQVAADVGASSTSLDSSIAMVSVVGAGMIGRPGIASEMFRALSEAGINIQMVSTGEIRISCIVDESEAESAVRAVHDTFGLSDA